MARSGETKVWTAPPPSLSTMEKPRSSDAGISQLVTRSTWAAGGASLTKRARNPSRVARGPSDLDEDTLGVVAHVAGQVEPGGQAVHEGPEAHALDEAGHPDPEADRRPRGGQAGHAGVPLRRPRLTAASRCIRPKL